MSEKKRMVKYMTPRKKKTAAEREAALMESYDKAKKREKQLQTQQKLNLRDYMAEITDDKISVHLLDKVFSCNADTLLEGVRKSDMPCETLRDLLHSAVKLVKKKEAKENSASTKHENRKRSGSVSAARAAEVRAENSEHRTAAG